MKIIDLYVKMANGEIIPRYIKVHDRKYEFDSSDNEYYPRNENDNDTLLERISRGNVYLWLNSEIEELDTLEEEKKIPEKLELPSFIEFKTMSPEARYVVTAKEYDVLNEIIDYLKSKGE